MKCEKHTLCSDWIQQSLKASETASVLRCVKVKCQNITLWSLMLWFQQSLRWLWHSISENESVSPLDWVLEIFLFLPSVCLLLSSKSTQMCLKWGFFLPFWVFFLLYCLHHPHFRHLIKSQDACFVQLPGVPCKFTFDLKIQNK